MSMPEPPLGAPVLEGAHADVVDAAVDALLRLARDRPWSEIALLDVARGAGVAFAELYARAPGKRVLLAHLSSRYDRAALARVEGDVTPGAVDRLFEAMMARLEVMQDDKIVLVAIARAERLAVGGLAAITARALAEAAGVDTSGLRGGLRLAALTPVWLRLLQVWRDDEGSLNRTMAEADRLLKRADARLRRFGAGLQPSPSS